MRKILFVSSYSPATQRHYCSEMRLLFRHYYGTKPKELNEAMIVDYICYLKSNFNSSYNKIRILYYSVRYFFKTVLEKPFDVSTKLFPRREYRLPRVMSVFEVTQLINAAVSLKCKTILMLTYSSGLRFGEVQNLRVSDIDTAGLKILIRQGKGKKDRFAILSQKMIPVLEDYIRKYEPENYLFNGHIKGSQHSRGALRTSFVRTCKRAGFGKKYSMHSLRHSFATHLLDMGTSIFSIKELLGHNHISSTMVYLQMSEKKFDSLFSPLDMLPI